MSITRRDEIVDRGARGETLEEIAAAADVIDTFGYESIADWRRDTPASRIVPDAQQKAAGKIVLDGNGSFVAFEIPEDLLYGPPQAGVGLVTGNGVWKLVSLEGKQQVRLNFETISVGQRGKVPYGTQLNVSRGWSTVKLFYFQSGDADQGRRIEFEKTRLAVNP